VASADNLLAPRDPVFALISTLADWLGRTVPSSALGFPGFRRGLNQKRSNVAEHKMVLATGVPMLLRPQRSVAVTQRKDTAVFVAQPSSLPESFTAMPLPP
jgi:hypothetical protein